MKSFKYPPEASPVDLPFSMAVLNVLRDGNKYASKGPK
jgi:hypothetical protein